MGRYFDEMQSVVERHEGIVEKFIGDAVMAVFGIPIVHEDDALRAVRAAMEMRERLSALNEELARDWGVTIAVRPASIPARSSPATRAAGSACDRRRGQRRQALRGGRAARRDPARRADVHAGARCRRGRGGRASGPQGQDRGGRRLPAPQPGRETCPAVRGGSTRRWSAASGSWLPSSRPIGEQWASARAICSRCSARRVSASRGSSPSSWAASATRPTIMRGRCLPYGEGITYWPLAEALRGRYGDDPLAGIEGASRGTTRA